jgi:predicted transposase YdaD
MAVLRESPWYQEILTEGEERGLQQGLQQGGRQQLIRVLRRRFGEIPQEVEARLESESVEQLETLMDSAIAVSSLDEFVQILFT